MRIWSNYKWNLKETFFWDTLYIQIRCIHKQIWSGFKQVARAMPGHSTAKCEVMVSLGWGMDFKLRSTNELVGIIEQIRSWHYRVDQNCNVLTQETLSLSVYHIVIMKYKISTNVFRVSVHLSFWLVQWWRNWYKRKL